jgi:beta-galactosidase
MRKTVTALLAFLTISLYAQNTHSIDVSKVKTSVVRGHLDLGGKNPAGDSIGVNSFYLERNNKPFIPVFGEFHFCRYPNQDWEQEIRKMKAGGITIIATYIFWNLHEYREGQFNWSGDLDVRHFVELCAKNGVEVLVRIGPFDHGEIRNGGLPDWLYGRPIDIRSNDKTYLFYANRLYQEIGKQLKGLMFKDGGPVVGVQLENEYQHSAAPWGFTFTDAPRENTSARRDQDITQVGVGINSKGNQYAAVGKEHMRTLKQMAVEAGLVAPLYTATGWGFASIIDKASIPVMAGYAYPFWEAGIKPSMFYLYKDIKLNPDYSPVSYDTNLYPSMAAELGTGISVLYSRRPRVPAESMLPLMVRTVGSGTNGLGYYMYHGGTTPSIDNFYFSEGFGLNSKSYDYQAPLGEFGYATGGYYSLKLINYFLRDFGSDLAPLYTTLPVSNNASKPEETSVLRYAVRSDGNKGYVFMHNFQDHATLTDLKDLRIEVQTKTGVVNFPSSGTFTLKPGYSAILPFNTNYDGIEINIATVQPFCRFVNKGNPYNVFVSLDGIAPEIILKGKPKVSGTGIRTEIIKGNTIIRFPARKITVFQVNGRSFMVLPYEQALNSYTVGDKDKKLIISSALVTESEGTIELLSTKPDSTFVSVFPSVDELTSSTGKAVNIKSGIQNLSQWKIELPAIDPGIRLEQADARHFVLHASSVDWTKFNDIFIMFNYRGDRGLCMMKGILQTDNFYTSRPWIIGLKRYADKLKTNEMYFYFIPMQKDAPYMSYLDKEVIPQFGNRNEFLEIKEPGIEVEYKVRLFFK